MLGILEYAYDGLMDSFFWGPLKKIVICLAIGIAAIILLNKFYFKGKKISKLSKFFIGTLIISGLLIFGFVSGLNEGIGKFLGMPRDIIGAVLSKYLGFESEDVDFIFVILKYIGLDFEGRMNDALFSETHSFLYLAEKLAKILFLLAGIFIGIVFVKNKIGRKNSEDESLSDKKVCSSHNENEVGSENINGEGMDGASFGSVEESHNKMKIIAIVSIVMWALIGLLIHPFCFWFIGLAFIPAKIAESKERDFWTWYTYGIWLWFIAFIHALFINVEMIGQEPDSASLIPSEEKAKPTWIMKTFAIFSIVLWALIGILSGEIILCMFIGLAFIPAKLAQKKGRDFWTWYVYGIWLWLIAFPHALFIKKKEATSAAETQGNEQPVPAN